MYRLLASVLIAAACAAQATAQQQAYGSVEGRVTNAQTGDAISGASLHLNPLIRRSQGKSPQTQAASSQADGSFRFDAVAPGTYFLSAEHTGFVATTLNGAPQAISVSAGQQVTNIAVQLNPQAVVSGKVLEENGDAAAGAQVEAFTTYTTRGKPQLRRTASTTAAKTGEYTLKNLAPGTYYLAAEPASRAAGASPEAQKKEPAASKEESPGVEPVRTFYPEALDLDGAAPLEITAGQNLADATIHLRRVAIYHIRGKIDVAIASNPSRGWTISLSRRNAMGPDADPRSERPNADHTFDIANVIAGSYTLTLTGIESGSSAQSGRMPFRNRLLARQDIDVAAEDVNGVVLSIIPPVSLTGRVALESSGIANLSQVRVNLSPAGAMPIGGFQSVAVNGDGVFAVEGLDPGEYMVHVAGVPAGMYVKSISFNRQDITTAGLDLLQGGSGEMTSRCEPEQVKWMGRSSRTGQINRPRAQLRAKRRATGVG